MKKNIAIALDAMGGDNAPTETVKAAVQSLQDKRLHLILTGDKDIINKQLSNYTYDSDRLEIIHAKEVITNQDSPVTAIRQKKDSSMVVGFNLLKDGAAQGFVSAGNTGALLAGSTMKIGRISGIERPAIATLLPNDNKSYTLLIDSGANVDCKAAYLLQFAKMGIIYMKHMLNIDNPRVGLASIGTEQEKGNLLTKETYELLEAQNFNFVGNIEGSQISTGVVDVLVCDGFIGNIILKHTEGLAKSILQIIKRELVASPISKIGALMAKGAFKRIKKQMDYTEVGGAPLLGLKALVVKAHGSSNSKAIVNAIKQSVNFIENDIITKIGLSLQG